MKVICISGSASAGKDSLANCLKEILEEQKKKTLIIHYADYLKFLCKSYFDWDGNKDEKGRTLLQYTGTDVARARRPTVWVDVVKIFIDVFGRDYDYILIPDTRFPQEIDLCKESYDTTSIKIIRPNFDNGLTEAQKNHESETALNNYSFDITINCSSGLDNVMAGARTLIEEVLGIGM